MTALVGGTVFSMASHGADQLIVQRLLACKSEEDSKKAIVVSALIVMVQFALFLTVGLLLWAFYDYSSVADLGLSRVDEVFPKFIIEEMPSGVAGLLIAGILAAAMSTLSSSLNALASSTIVDIFQRFKKGLSDADILRTSRIFTLLWGLVFIAFANLFESQRNPVVELGLAIASFTYGGLLGAFLLGIFNKTIRQREALISFGLTIALMVWVIFGVWYSTESHQWIFEFYPSTAQKAEMGLKGIAWPWYTAIGAGLCLLLGHVLNRLSSTRK